MYSVACWAGGSSGEAHGAHLVQLEGGLAEAGLGVGAADAGRWARSRSLTVGGAAGGDEGAELRGFGVGGAELEGLVDLAVGVGEVAAAEVGDGEIVVVVGVVGVGGGGALEERRRRPCSGG